MKGYTFKMKSPCFYYTCANCPYRVGAMCFYDELNKRDIMADKKEDSPIEVNETKIDKSELMDATTVDIQYLIDELFDRTGVINDLKISLPRSCLKDVCKVLEKNEFPEMRCQINVYTSFVLLHFFNKAYPQRGCWDD